MVRGSADDVADHHRRVRRWRPRPGCQDSITMWSAGLPTYVSVTSVISILKLAPAPPEAPATVPVSTTVPASFASPGQALGSPSGGSSVGLCTAMRGSRRTSRSFVEPLPHPRRELRRVLLDLPPCHHDRRLLLRHLPASI